MFSMLAIIATVVLLASAVLWRAARNLPRTSARLAAILRGLSGRDPDPVEPSLGRRIAPGDAPDRRLR